MRPLKIAIASVDIAGPYQCGGVGAAYQGLALALAEAGHNVTVVYLHHRFHQGTQEEWTEYFRQLGIRFVHLPQPPESPIWYASRKEASYRCYQWLSRQPAFDVIHFHEWLGLPYYSVVAKRQGLAFDRTLLCVGTHGPMRWSREGDEALPQRAEDLVVDYLERKSVEYADVAVSPSEYLLRWFAEDGWTLPANCFVEHNILQAPPLPARADGEARPVRELVFFGRLERRKGLPFFCDVLDDLQDEAAGEYSVTFLGSEAAVDGARSLDYLRSRAAKWRRQPSVVTSVGRNEALEYLAGPGRLAVMPSQTDNSPCTIQECLALGIPFLSSDRGGIPELVAPEDRERVTAPLVREEFVRRLREALQNGHRPGRVSESVARSKENWIRWHAELPDSGAAGRAEVSGAGVPMVSVCISHYRRPGLLRQMLHSLVAQTWKNFEVVLVDDGSPDEESRAMLEGLEEEFASRGWQLLRQENQGPGAARHRAALAARGEWLLFADDDDALLPNTIETFARVGRHTGADALSCVLLWFEGERVPERIEDAIRPLIPLGPALAAGLICPEFGGTAYMLRRECYFGVGGFRRDRDCDEDWELLLSVVAQGYQLEAIPEPLVWYRKQAESRSKADNKFARNQSRLRAYEKMLPPELRDLAALAFSRLSSAPDVGTQRRLDRVIQSLEKVRLARPGGVQGS